MLKKKYYTVSAALVLATVAALFIGGNITKAVLAQGEKEDSGNQVLSIMGHFKKGENDLTIRLAKEYLAVNPKDVTVLNALAEAYANKGDFSSAETTVKDALAIQPNEPWSLRLLGSIYSKKNDFALALEQLEKGLASNPNDIMLLAEVAKIYSAQGNKAKAKEAIDKALNITPNDQYLIQIKNDIISEKLMKK